MDSNLIVSFERGVLYLKLREKLITSTMELSYMLVEISREGMNVVCAENKGDINSTSMKLSFEEAKLIACGVERVDRYWESMPLGKREVLLGCGHIINWDEWNEWKSQCVGAPGFYPTPAEEHHVYCFECDETTSIHRFNPADFELVEHVIQGHCDCPGDCNH